jgi:hypothetical protein
MTQHLDIVEVVRQYEEGKTASEIAREHSCSVWSVLKRLRDTGIEIEKNPKARFLAEPKTIDFAFQEIVDGLMLGDGSISKKNIMRVEQANKRLGWLEQLKHQLELVGCDSKLLPLKQREKKWIVDHWSQQSASTLLYTPSYKECKEQRKRWYPDGTKQIPGDLKLTPIVVSHWFAGDGTYNTNGTLTFCTQNFTEAEVKGLVKLLARDISINAQAYPNKQRPGQWTITLTKRSETVRLKDQIWDLLPDCCKYKLQHVRPVKRTGQLTKHQIRDIRSSNRPRKVLAKKYNISVTALANIVNYKTYKWVN